LEDPVLRRLVLILIIAVGLTGPGLSALAELRERVAGAAARTLSIPEDKRFSPHVTLGRFHRPTEATRWIRALDAWEGPAWRVEQLALVESHLGEGRGRRPRYEVLAELPLRLRPPRTD